MAEIIVRIVEDKYGESFTQTFNDPNELPGKTRYFSPEGVIYSIKSTAVAGEISQK